MKFNKRSQLDTFSDVFFRLKTRNHTISHSIWRPLRSTNTTRAYFRARSQVMTSRRWTAVNLQHQNDGFMVEHLTTNNQVLCQFYCQSQKHFLKPSRERECVRERRLEERKTTLKDKERRSQAWRSRGAAAESCSSEKFWSSNRLLPPVCITAQQLPGGWNTYTEDRSEDSPCSVAHTETELRTSPPSLKMCVIKPRFFQRHPYPGASCILLKIQAVAFSSRPYLTLSPNCDYKNTPSDAHTNIHTHTHTQNTCLKPNTSRAEEKQLAFISSTSVGLYCCAPPPPPTPQASFASIPIKHFTTYSYKMWNVFFPLVYSKNNSSQTLGMSQEDTF